MVVFPFNKWWNSVDIFSYETQYRRIHLHIHICTHPYEHAYTIFPYEHLRETES
jgi:hypothetical protein